MSREDVAAIDNWLEDVGTHWDVNEPTIFGVRLCIAELAANAVEHGISRSNNDHVVVVLRRVRNAIEVEFLDSRAPFDPTAKPNSTSEQSIVSISPAGRGLTLLHAYAKDLSYSHDGTYNRVTLTISAA